MAKKAAAAPARLTTADVTARERVHATTLWRWVRDGKFPAPHYIGERRMWWLSEVEAWEAAQMARAPSERRGARNLTANAGEGAQQ